MACLNISTNIFQSEVVFRAARSLFFHLALEATDGIDPKSLIQRVRPV
jgi:hypothetical protein